MPFSLIFLFLLLSSEMQLHSQLCFLPKTLRAQHHCCAHRWRRRRDSPASPLSAQWSPCVAGGAASWGSFACWAFASLHPALRALGSAPLASKLALGFKSFLQHEKETANAISFSCVRTIKKIFLPFLRMTSNPHIISKCLKNPCFTRLFQRSHLDLGVQISPLYSVHLETERSEPSQSRTRFFFH